MRQILAVALGLLWAQTALAQDTLETFKAGKDGPQIPFFVHDSIDSGRVAFLLPESLAGRMIYSLRTHLSQTNNGPVDEEKWLSHAAFSWGLSYGTSEQPLATSMDSEPLNLTSDPNLRVGGWVEVQVQWPVIEGQRVWLVGYWQRKAEFIRLTSNQYDPEVPVIIGFRSDSVDSWQFPASVCGLMVEVAHGVPGLGIPSGVLDLSEPVDRGDFPPLHASVSGSTLSISLADRSDWSHTSYTLQVVNVLGQTVVSHTGYMPDAGDLRIPWSANRPSGVYFCRIQLGSTSYTIPVVNLK
jgi:hypothetical protein